MKTLDMAEIVRMYQGWMTPAEIAKALGTSRRTIQRRLQGHPCLRSRSESKKLDYAMGRQKPPQTWTGKTQPAAMVEARSAKIRGSNHWAWKGGKERRGYRGVVEKRACERCRARLNLCLHHRDFDHYNDKPENLAVLCVSCHLSLHKTAYWAAVKAGKTPLLHGLEAKLHRVGRNLPRLCKL
jgi:hypothetical protein